jgi:hypothetical protein
MTTTVAGDFGLRIVSTPKWSRPSFNEKLRLAGVMGNKHVPDAYLRSSRDQRLALLQGLMDSDGSVVKENGLCVFTNADEHLADAVSELVASLGSHWQLRRSQQPSGKGRQVIHQVTFSLPLPAFRLNRKARAQKLESTRARRDHIVTAIAPVASVPVQCLTTDSPSHLFLVGQRMVPTHNSIYRPAYKNWFIRDQLYKIQAIGLERTYMGIPVADLPENYSDEMKALALQIVTNLRTDDNAGITKPVELGLDILHNAINAGTEMQAAIAYHSREILKSSLAHFLDLGSAGSSGSWALSSDQSELFLMAINAPANMVEEQFNLDPGIPALMRFNFPDAQSANMPHLTHGDIGQRSFSTGMGRTIMALGQWGFLTPDDATEDWFRQVLDMPERDSTIDAEALKTLIPEMFPGRQDVGRTFAPKPAPQTPQTKQAPASAQVPRTPQTKVTPQTPVGGNAAMMSELAARSPWERPNGRLTAQDRLRIRLTEELIDTLDRAKHEAGRTPERPSIRMARNRRPYALAMAEKPSIKQRIADVNAKAKAGELKPVGGTPPPKKVVQRHQLQARKQGKDIEKFFKGLKP